MSTRTIVRLRLTAWSIRDRLVARLLADEAGMSTFVEVLILLGIVALIGVVAFLLKNAIAGGFGHVTTYVNSNNGQIPSAP